MEASPTLRPMQRPVTEDQKTLFLLLAASKARPILQTPGSVLMNQGEQMTESICT